MGANAAIPQDKVNLVIHWYAQAAQLACVGGQLQQRRDFSAAGQFRVLHPVPPVRTAHNEVCEPDQGQSVVIVYGDGRLEHDVGRIAERVHRRLDRGVQGRRLLDVGLLDAYHPA